jgi:hypothetical protein
MPNADSNKKVVTNNHRFHKNKKVTYIHYGNTATGELRMHGAVTTA